MRCDVRPRFPKRRRFYPVANRGRSVATVHRSGLAGGILPVAGGGAVGPQDATDDEGADGLFNAGTSQAEKSGLAGFPYIATERGSTPTNGLGPSTTRKRWPTPEYLRRARFDGSRVSTATPNPTHQERLVETPGTPAGPLHPKPNHQHTSQTHTMSTTNIRP